MVLQINFQSELYLDFTSVQTDINQASSHITNQRQPPIHTPLPHIRIHVFFSSYLLYCVTLSRLCSHTEQLLQSVLRTDYRKNATFWTMSAIHFIISFVCARAPSLLSRTSQENALVHSWRFKPPLLCLDDYSRYLTFPHPASGCRWAVFAITTVALYCVLHFVSKHSLLTLSMCMLRS